MKKAKELIPEIIALLILLALACIFFYYVGIGIIAAVNQVFVLIERISTLNTVLIIALISGAISILGILVNSIVSVKLKASEYKYKAKAEMQAKMEKPYENFVNIIFDIMLYTKNKKKMSDKEMLNRVTDFSKQVTLYGSNKVIKKWSSYRTSADKLSASENLKQLENILFAIRSDLGLKKGALKTGDLLSLFINDAKETILKKQ